MAGSLAAATAQADFPYPAPSGNSHDWTQLHVPSGTLPNDLNPDSDWRFYSTPEDNNFPVNNDPRELNGIRGGWVADKHPTAKTAWSVTTGRPDVKIAELDSGVEWNDRGFILNERFKIALNAGELPVPNHSGPDLVGGTNCGSYANQDDANGDGVFNLRDYACDDRLSQNEPNSVGPTDLLDPQDLIIAFTNKSDADGNGYVDDIAGWDFLDDDNDPYDDVQYGHGTGEIEGSTGEANNGGGTPGFCPNCMGIPLRVGNSFVADDNRFAMATTYGVDRGVDIVQEALGTLNNSRFGQAAIDYAYEHGVALIASAADEAAQHHNFPSSHEHTIVVNSVRNYGGTPPEVPRTYVAFNGCTNFSSKITLAIPSTSCSSNATEVGAGEAGLVYSAAKNAVEQNKLAPHPGCKRVDGSPCPITANEVRQLMASGAFGPNVTTLTTQPDDVNYLAGNPGEPTCSPTPAPGCTDPNLALQQQVNANRPIVSPPDSRSYPARFGHDQFFGWGRINTWRATDHVAAGHVPPEVEITGPEWFAQVDPSKPTLDVQGQVWARGAEFTCAVYVAPGSYPNNHFTTDTPPGDFQKVTTGPCDGTTKHKARIDGSVGGISLAALRGRFPPDANDFRGTEQGSGAGQTSNGRPNSEPYGFTVRVIATTTAENPGLTATGEDRRNLYLHRDRDMLDGFPKRLPSDGASSPAFADLNGDNRNEMVFGTSDGFVHAMKRDGSELAGWPVRTDRIPVHTGEHAFTSGELSPDLSHGAVLSTVAVGDLDRDGSPEVVASDMEGKVYVWSAQARRLWMREANPAWSGKPLQPFVNERLGRRDRTMHAFIASPVLADLDGDGRQAVIAAGMDRHLYAWTPEGSRLPGFPLLVTDPDKTASIDPDSQEVRFDLAKAPDEGSHTPDQGAIIDTPAVANVAGDARPEIILGTNEEYKANKGNEGPQNVGGANAATIQALGPALAAADLEPGNSRLYAIQSTGDRDGKPATADWLAPGDWPAKIALLKVDLLPVVGEGITGAPIVGPVSCPSGGGGNKIGVLPNNGLAYVLNGNGTSCLGRVGGKDQTMDTDKGGGGDHPAFAAVGHPAFGDFGGGMTFFGPVAGLVRALDLAVNEYQNGGQDFISAWDPSTGQFRPGYPQRMNDLQFLTGPSVANVSGAAGSELLEGSAYLDLQAFTPQGTAAARYPKLTSDWVVANPLIGTWGTRDTDPGVRRVVAEVTRNGTVLAYRTDAPACESDAKRPLGQWPHFHHDLANSGDYSRDAVDPGAPMDVKFGGGKLTFKAPGDDLLCGKVARYEIVESDFPIGGGNFDRGDPVPTAGLVPAAPGQAQTLALPGKLRRYVAVRAVDEQGNFGPTVRVATGATTPCGKPPVTTIDPKSLQRSKGGFQARGTTTYRGCRKINLSNRARAVTVSVSIAKLVGGKCRFLQRDGSLTARRSCSQPVKLRSQGKYSIAEHKLSWSYRPNGKLPAGHYVANARGVDIVGNVERGATKANRREFTLK